ncbi:MAG: ribose-phosphate diphosphokinase [Anaplasma sp.]
MIIVPGGDAAAALSASLSSIAGLPVVSPRVSRFADGEINIEFPDSHPDAQHRDVILVQSLCAPVNDSLIELFLLADVVRRVLLPNKITAIVPYLCYSRQDRVTSCVRESETVVSPLSSKVIANLFEASGIDHVVTVDLHSSQIAGFFNVTLTNLRAFDVFIDEIIGSHMLDKLAVVAPDCGSLARAREFISVLSKSRSVNSVQLAVIDKYRESPGVSEVMHVIGNVKDRHCFILDDIVDSGGTLCNAAAALKTRGATSVHGCITHGILSGNAAALIEASELDSLVVTDTISNSKLADGGKIRVQSVDRLLGSYILSHIL